MNNMYESREVAAHFGYQPQDGLPSYLYNPKNLLRQNRRERLCGFIRLLGRGLSAPDGTTLAATLFPYGVD